MSKRKLLFREIVLALAIKLVLLYGLWFFCFSHPVDKQLSPIAVSNHLMTTQ